MRIALFEIGDYHDGPDIVRVFSSVKKAKDNIPAEFKEKDSPSNYCYYEDEISGKWLSITEHEVDERYENITSHIKKEMV